MGQRWSPVCRRAKTVVRDGLLGRNVDHYAHSRKYASVTPMLSYSTFSPVTLAVRAWHALPGEFHRRLFAHNPMIVSLPKSMAMGHMHDPIPGVTDDPVIRLLLSGEARPSTRPRRNTWIRRSPKS